MQTFLIVGGNKKKREIKAEEILDIRISGQENNPDFFHLEPLLSIGIEEARNLQKFLQLKAYGVGKKLVYISEAQFLTEEAQNALLKTLEEPAENCLLVLSAPDDSLLLPTIVSRCEIVQLPQEAQVFLDKEEKAKAIKELKKLFSLSVGERLIFLEEEGIYKEKENVINWLDKMTVAGREVLLSEKNPEKILKFLKGINQVKSYLKANCNLRLTMEVFISEID